MLRSPGTASSFAPLVEDLIDLRGVRAFARRERLGQIEERVPRQIPFPRRPFGEGLSCGLLQGEPFGLRRPQDERIDHGIHLRLDHLLPMHRKGKWTWTIYMFSLHVSTRWDSCPQRQEQQPTRSVIPPWNPDDLRPRTIRGSRRMRREPEPRCTQDRRDRVNRPKGTAQE